MDRAGQAKKAKSVAVPKARVVPFKSKKGWQRYLPRSHGHRARPPHLTAWTWVVICMLFFPRPWEDSTQSQFACCYRARCLVCKQEVVAAYVDGSQYLVTGRRLRMQHMLQMHLTYVLRMCQGRVYCIQSAAGALNAMTAY